jgi:hypothetical protein
MTDFFVLVHSPTLPFDGSMAPIAALGPYAQDAAERLAVRMGAFENRTAEVVTVVPETVEVIAFPVSLHDSENLTSALFSHLIKGSEAASNPAAERVRESGKIEKVNPSAETLVRELTMPEHVRLLKEALDVPERDSYTFEDLLDVASAEVVRKNFTSWVISRFVEEGESGMTFEVADGSRPAGTMVAVEAPSVWETWKMQPLTDPRSIASLVTVDGDLPFLRMQKYTADDRGPGSYGPVLAFPLEVLFGERKRKEAYAEFLRLKAIFEPGESAGASESGSQS